MLDPQGTNFGDIHVPYGGRVAIASQAMQNDNDVYPNANHWDAFHFSAPYEDPETGAEVKNQSVVNPSNEFLTFGIGRHACPGRFFATSVIKMLPGVIVLHYDVEPLKERPATVYLLERNLPSKNGMLRVRRRRDSWVKDVDRWQFEG